MEQKNSSEHPPVVDKLIALFFWWLPFLAFIPITSERTSQYVRGHLMAVRCSVVVLIALVFATLFAQSLVLYVQTGDALRSFAQTIPSLDGILEGFFGIFGLETNPPPGSADLVDLSFFWFGAVLLNTFAVSRGRFPFFLAPSALRPIARGVGVLALVTTWLAWTVSFAVSGEVGPVIDEVDLSTTLIGVICMVAGFLLLGRTYVTSEIILLFGGSLVSGGVLIWLMDIDLSAAFLVWLGVSVLALGLLVRLLSEWRVRRKTHQVSAEKGTT